MKTRNIITIGLTAVLLSSCKAYHSLYDNYERPDVRTDSIVRSPINDNLYLNTDTTGFGNLPWRSVFTDPILQDIISRTLANNPDLLNALQNIESSLHS